MTILCCNYILPNRRLFLAGLTASVAASVFPAGAQQPNFESLLREYTANERLLENAWKYREVGVTRGVGRGTRSSRKISQSAIDLIVELEVGGRSQYERKYRKPIWPRGESGVTMGIGYDLRFANSSLLKRDWENLLTQQELDILKQVLGKGGEAARVALPSVQTISIPWPSAMTQFLNFLPYPTADAESIFPNSNELSDESFGALVSLVYNRGKAIPRNSPRRTEMVAIHDLMGERKFGAIPEQIRKMKKLWTTPDSRGLVIRRELEALLFELGLK
ncbi:hypothetical protein EDE05_11798 [Neorhizobium sp. R1-B]|uniref:hypothetical protein n=1 Tax=Neorhizobium sp. R1-B TaxID=2485162 RepID=UPI001065DCEC|nr:hypothetical protein [Neorhizobium sp. R1-B]TDX76216.1 hypothetical protein EDE05_11798 [Neorhizobium sp. R1-B]